MDQLVHGPWGPWADDPAGRRPLGLGLLICPWSLDPLLGPGLLFWPWAPGPINPVWDTRPYYAYYGTRQDDGMFPLLTKNWKMGGLGL